MSTSFQKLQETLASLPLSPGVYFFKNAGGEILYIGKSNSLKNRVSSYFNASAKNERLTLLVQSIEQIDYILALSEKNALALEANLVKKHQPKFNILLKDDKHPPYIKIKMTDDYPAIEVTRTIRKDGAKYFGPYFGGVRVNDVVSVLKSAYKIRTCQKTVFKSAKRECLDYHINLCFGVCQKRISKEEYREKLEKAIAFLKGKDKSAYDLIHERMLDAADREEFERAISYKEQLKTLAKLKERELTDLVGERGDINLDSYSIKSDEFLTVISQVIVRGGKLMGVNNHSFETLTNESDALMGFLTQYYSKNTILPEEILIDEFSSHLTHHTSRNNGKNEFDEQMIGAATDLPHEQNIFAPANSTTKELLEGFLETLSSKKVEVLFPQKGKKKSLVFLARENALEHLEKGRSREERTLDRTARASDELAKLLGIPSCKRIECYDISNISGTFNVASRVVFENGVPSKKDYRRYKIKTVIGADDFASMAEVISRRFNSTHNSQSTTHNEDESSFDGQIVVASALDRPMLIAEQTCGRSMTATTTTNHKPKTKNHQDEVLPSLIVIDGGKGQLNAAIASLKKANLAHLDIIGLAKKEEEIYLPNNELPLRLDIKSNAMHLLIRIRDEAHRFALKYHKKLREKI
ncbi:MAG: excinuclease ABC subunit UvrC [Firmicutes bacterium]|nr:excinuclease ABC subunit UvrC [Bacillota bacterium]